MFYVKNVPGWERALRVVAGLIAMAIGFGAVSGIGGGIWSWVVAASAAGIVASGLFGFCPMCAMVGRRLDKAARQANRKDI
jgi:hypothetical protein